MSYIPTGAHRDTNQSREERTFARLNSLALMLNQLKPQEVDNSTVLYLADWLILVARKKSGETSKDDGTIISQSEFFKKLFKDVILPDKICFNVKMVKYFVRQEEQHDLANDSESISLTTIR